ncbi:hypothetical protein V6N13_093129 [Hibiscus sabdariffa]
MRTLSSVVKPAETLSYPLTPSLPPLKAVAALRRPCSTSVRANALATLCFSLRALKPSALSRPRRLPLCLSSFARPSRFLAPPSTSSQCKAGQWWDLRTDTW